MGAKHKPERCVFELCHFASERIKAAGFEFCESSMKTEACYYRWPGKTTLLRVAAHRSDSRNKGIVGKTVSRLTFTGNHGTKPDKIRISDEKVDQMIAQAIGWYFLRS